MAKKAREIELMIRLVESGNYDAAHNEIERLRTQAAKMSTEGVTGTSRLSAAWQKWTSLAETSSGKIRNAFLTILGPIGAIITIIQAVVGVLRIVVTAYSKWREEIRKNEDALRSSEFAIKSARGSLESFAKATGEEQLTKGIKAHRKNLEDLDKEYKKTAAEMGGWWDRVSSAWGSGNAALGEQLALNSRVRGEMERHLAVLEKQLAIEKEIAETKRLQLSEEEEMYRRYQQLTLSQTEFAIEELNRKAAYRRSIGVDELKVEIWLAAEMRDIQAKLDAARVAGAKVANARIKTDTKNTMEEVREVSVNAGDIVAASFAKAASDIIVNAQNVEQVVKGMIQSIEAAFIQLGAQQLAQQAIGALGLSPLGAIGTGLGLGLVSKFFAGGGVVNRPTRAIVGEAGPEAIVPLGSRGPGVAARRALYTGIASDLRGGMAEARALALLLSRQSQKFSRYAA